MDGNTKKVQPMTDERETMEAAQDALGQLKKHLRNLQKINESAGQTQEANEVYHARQSLGVWHAEVTRSLHNFWPDFASEIQTRGPGGR